MSSLSCLQLLHNTDTIIVMFTVQLHNTDAIIVLFTVPLHNTDATIVLFTVQLCYTSLFHIFLVFFNMEAAIMIS